MLGREMVKQIFFPILIVFFLTHSAIARDLIYILVDPSAPIQARKSLTNAVEELVLNEFKKDLAYIQIAGLGKHYQTEGTKGGLPVHNLAVNTKQRRFLKLLNDISSSADLADKLASRFVNQVESISAEVILGAAARNLKNIRTDFPDIKNVYLILLGELKFDEPVKTDGLILGDGWITAQDSPFFELVSGTQADEFNHVEVIAIIEPERWNNLYYHTLSAQFHSRLFSAMGAELKGYLRITDNPFVSGLILGESIKRALNTQNLSHPIGMPNNTALLQLTDPNTRSTRTVK
jgi:hypothetical protein